MKIFDSDSIKRAVRKMTDRGITVTIPLQVLANGRKRLKRFLLNRRRARR